MATIGSQNPEGQCQFVRQSGQIVSVIIPENRVKCYLAQGLTYTQVFPREREQQYRRLLL